MAQIKESPAARRASVRHATCVRTGDVEGARRWKREFLSVWAAAHRAEADRLEAEAERLHDTD